jgi:hypothetical protein
MAIGLHSAENSQKNVLEAQTFGTAAIGAVEFAAAPTDTGQMAMECQGCSLQEASQ